MSTERTFKIVMTPTVRSAPIGRCIYCCRWVPLVPNLTDEHVIPQALGGTIVLVEATCKDCADETSRIERAVLRGPMRDIRYRLRMGKRRQKSRPKEAEVHVPLWIDPEAEHLPVYMPEPGEGDLQWEQRTVLFNDQATLVALPRFPEPGILRGLSRDESWADWSPKTESWWCYVIRPDNPESAPVSYASAQFETSVFMRMIAKIAHGFAVYQYGAGNFVPLLPKIILGKDLSGMAQYMGCDRETPPAEAAMTLSSGVTRIPGDVVQRWYIGVTVRLFAHLAMVDSPEHWAPVYLAIAGQIDPRFATVSGGVFRVDKVFVNGREVGNDVQRGIVY